MYFKKYYRTVESKIIMSVDEYVQGFSKASPNWEVTHYGNLSTVISSTDGAKIKFFRPESGETIFKQFKKDSVLTFTIPANRLSYINTDEIPFDIPEPPPVAPLEDIDPRIKVISSLTDEEIADIAKDPKKLLSDAVSEKLAGSSSSSAVKKAVDVVEDVAEDAAELLL